MSAEWEPRYAYNIDQYWWRQAEAYAYFMEHRFNAIKNLLDSLTPADAHRPLFTWAEQKEWNLKRKKL